MPSTEQLRTRLIEKLKELFQLDQPDLDFGFYRIMHAKSKQVTEFLENDLLAIVSQAFGEAASGKTQQALAAARQKVEQALGANAIDEHGAIKDAFAETPAGKEYKTAFEKAHTAQDTAQAEGEVYDHLYRFFERYYEDADFISRRYSTRETDAKAAPFAIPYSGEEVKLHWANADQYYIKTGEYFTNFTVDLRHAREIVAQQAELGLSEDDTPIRVHFRLVDAVEGEHGNVKPSDANRRFFLLHEADPVGFNGQGDLDIRFEYRADPEKTGQDIKWQEKRRDEAVTKLLAAMEHLSGADKYRRLLGAKAPTETNKDRTILAKYLYQYTARNTCDYFIHKDLGGFLRRELDFYIKNEVMRLDDIEDAAAPGVESYLGKIKVMRRIAHELIAFLEQLEDFQKRLWLKKKFVSAAHYCLTLDLVPESFYAAIAANEAQHKEWIDLFAIDQIVAEELGQVPYSNPLTVEFLKAHRHLVLDTRHFAHSFRQKLISSFANLDDALNGVCVQSENFHALQLMRERYRRQIKCVYIDPPYNLGNGDFQYKDEYRHSSWISFMTTAFRSAAQLLPDDSLIGVSIDDNELISLGLVLADTFGSSNRMAYAPWKAEPSGGKQKTGVRYGHEYLVIYTNGSTSGISRDETQLGEQTLEDELGPYIKGREIRKWGDASLREDRPKQFFPLKAPDGTEVLPYRNDGREGRWRWGKNNPFIKEGLENPNVFHWEQTPFDTGIEVGGAATRWDPFEKIRETVKESGWGTWLDDHGTNADGTKAVKGLFGDKVFGTPKPLGLIEWFGGLSAAESGWFLDFFAGSGTCGHAVINLNREDGGKRKYLLVEMGAYFDSVLVPRLKKAGYSHEWKDGKPQSRNSGVSHCFKYLRLESYEDALNNLRLADDPVRAEALQGNPDLRKDYMLRYMLDVETRGSQSLLNIQAFTDPTAYTLKIKKPGSDEYVERPVDLLETFNYLLGLRVEHIAAPQRFNAKFKREADPELPGDTQTRLVIDGRFETAEDGKWWFRKVEGWVPSDPEHPNNGHKDKVLSVWRNLPSTIERGAEGMEEDNLMLDEWFKKNRISTRDFEFDIIYVNGSNNLPNLQQEGDKWKVRLIEEDFMKRMWDVEDV